MDNFTASPNQEQKFSLRNFLSPKLIFIILGAVILIEIFFAIRTLSQPTPPPPPIAKPRALSGGSIALVSVGQTTKVGEVVSVVINLSTGGHPTDGTDVILRFDPKILEASSGALQKGTLYPEYPVLTVDSKKGILVVSGISSLNTNFNGTGILATINLKAKTTGRTAVTVDYQPGATTDSNIVEAGTTKDILEKVYNLDIEVKQ